MAAQIPVYFNVSNRLDFFWLGSFVLFVPLFLGLLKALKMGLLENNLIFHSG